MWREEEKPISYLTTIRDWLHISDTGWDCVVQETPSQQQPAASVSAIQLFLSSSLLFCSRRLFLLSFNSSPGPSCSSSDSFFHLVIPSLSSHSSQTRQHSKVDWIETSWRWSLVVIVSRSAEAISPLRRFCMRHECVYAAG
jgi:hypothetical protein